MKRKVSRLIFLLLLFSACGTPFPTDSIDRVEQTRTPLITITSTSALKSTSTPTQGIKDAIMEGRPSCQTAPGTAYPGSSVNVSVFNMPANHSVSVYVFSQLLNTEMTNNEGHVNTDIMIPTDAFMGLHLISVLADGTEVIAECIIRIWTELGPTPTLASKQISVTATQQALHDKLDKFCRSNQAWGFRFSPDGQWVAVFCNLDTIEFVRVDEAEKWELSSDALINPYTEYFIGVDHWSNDGAYAYVSLDPHTDGYWETFHQGIVLFRLNLETGEISEVLPLGKSNWIFYSFAFSPNDRRLAHIMTDRSPVILNIRDMQTGIEQSYKFDPKYNTGGKFVWSPDSKKLVFSIRQFDANYYEQVATSIVLWEKEKSNTTILIKDHEKNLVPTEWVNDTKIILQVEYEDDTKFEFDLISNELKQISP